MAYYRYLDITVLLLVLKEFICIKLFEIDLHRITLDQIYISYWHHYCSLL